MAKNKRQNPYIKHQRVYSDVIEQAVETGKNWRSICIILLIALLCSVAANIYQSTLTRIKPVVIEIDGYGIPSRLYAVDRTATKQSDLVIKAALSRVFKAMRGVSTDADIMKREINEMLFFFENGSLGFDSAASYIRNGKTSPFVRAQTEVSSLKIKNIAKISKSSWQLDWEEHVKNRSGKTLRFESFRAIVKTSRSAKMSTQMALVNPLGILIDDFNITELIK